MIRLWRWAKAVASAGTRAIAPPSTRICVTAIIAVEAWRRSTIVSAASPFTVSMNIVRAVAIGWYPSSSGR
jgi:hypothetical protein